MAKTHDDIQTNQAASTGTEQAFADSTLPDTLVEPDSVDTLATLAPVTPDTTEHLPPDFHPEPATNQPETKKPKGHKKGLLIGVGSAALAGGLVVLALAFAGGGDSAEKKSASSEPTGQPAGN